jgi:hypothetical protein
MAAVKVGSKWGYIDKSGTLAIPAQFDNACDFKDGLAAVASTTGIGYINDQGAFVIQPKFGFAGSFSDGLAPVRVKPASVSSINPMLSKSISPVGYIDNSGVYIIEPKFDDAKGFSEGLAAVWMTDILSGSSQLRYIDTTGQVVINPQEINPDYVMVNPVYGMKAPAGEFSDGLCAVWVAVYESIPGTEMTVFSGGKFGYMDTAGKIVIEPQFDYAGPFTNGLAMVQIGPVQTGLQLTQAYDSEGRPVDLGMSKDQPKCGYIDEEGTFVWETKDTLVIFN